MTNKEIKKICEEMQSLHTDMEYKFKITQTKKQVRIFWEYITYMNCDKPIPWTINLKDESEKYGVHMVYNEYEEFMYDELEDCTSLKSTIQSIVYYMITRY